MHEIYILKNVIAKNCKNNNNNNNAEFYLNFNIKKISKYFNCVYIE